MNKYKIIFYILCYYITGYDCKIFIPPKIFQENNIVVNTGDNLTLSCEGMEQLTWTIVNYNKINYNKSSIITYWNKTEKSNFMYASILRIQNVFYVNTGFFYCHGVKANKDDIQRATNIYVYVRDENRLCVVPTEELAVFTATPKTDFSIPCLPTSPDIKVELFTRYDDFVKPIQSDFDPHVGFKISLFKEDMEVVCQFSRNEHTENLTIFLDNTGLEEIKTSYIRSQNNGNIGYVGEMLILNFTAIISNTKFYSPTWLYDFDHIKSNRISILNNPLINVANGKLVTSSLIINNVTKNDEGVYTFIYTATDDYESVYINIADNALKNVSPKINSTSSDIFINATDDLTLVCEAPETINWYINNLYGTYDLNVNITMYQQSEHIYKSILTIQNATIENAGYFTCKPEYETSDISYRSVKIYIFVHDQNSLSKYVGNVSDPLIFIVNTISNIPCIPSSPDVNVTLTDSDGKEVLSGVISYSSKEGFSFIGTKIGLHTYKCIYQRLNYTESLTLPILILRDPIYETTSMIDGPKKNFIHIGEKLQLNCSLIIYDNVWKNYTNPYINWTFPETLIKDIDVIIEDPIFYKLENGQVLIRRLFIKQTDLRAEGDYECIIQNGMQITSLYKYINVLDPSVGDLKIHIPERKYIVINETLVLLCTYRVNYNIKFSLQWEFQNKTLLNTFRIIKSNLEIQEDIYGLVGSMYLTIKNVTLQDAGIYKCIVNNDLGSSKYYEQNISIYEPRFPNIFDSNLNNTLWKLNEGVSLNLYCLADGIPVPNITWFKNDYPWNIQSNNSRVSILENNTKIKFVYTKREDSGKYSCKVSNVKGKIQNNVMLSIFTDSSTWTTVQITLIVILIVVLIVLLITLAIKLYKERKRQLEFKVAGLHQFEEGAVDNINPDLGVDEQAELLPYDKNFEIPRDKLKLGQQLGSGFFGVVFQAEAINIFPEENKKVVAVKMVQRNADYMHIKALLSELKIMIHIGKHINVLNLLGACTRNIAKRELLVVVEYCRFGNLHDFVLKHRNHFINQIDPETGLIDLDIGENIIKYFDYKNSVKPSTDIKVQYYNIGTPESDSAHVSIQTGVKKHESIKAICTYDLLHWSLQISQGMKYLSSRKVLHGDLAARNILLTDNNIVKICDFGLAKNIYKNNNYKKTNDGPLPVKWMAPESIVDRLFSIESDVWSFGIVLWELFSLSRVPYPEMEVNNEFYNNLLNGYRMPKPDFATDKMYQIMLNCWQSNPLDRPTFITLYNEIGDMLRNSTQQYYIELNRTYANINNFKKQNDLLSIMKKPDYENMILISNTYKNIKNNLQNNSKPIKIQYTHKDTKINYATLALNCETNIGGN